MRGSEEVKLVKKRKRKEGEFVSEREREREEAERRCVGWRKGKVGGREIEGKER